MVGRPVAAVLTGTVIPSHTPGVSSHLQGERSARNNPEAGVWVEVAIAQVLVGAGSWTVFAEVMRTHVVQGERDRSSDLVLPHADLIAVDAAGLYGDR